MPTALFRIIFTNDDEISNTDSNIDLYKIDSSDYLNPSNEGDSQTSNKNDLEMQIIKDNLQQSYIRKSVTPNEVLSLNNQIYQIHDKNKSTNSSKEFKVNQYRQIHLSLKLDENDDSFNQNSSVTLQIKKTDLPNALNLKDIKKSQKSILKNWLLAQFVIENPPNITVFGRNISIYNKSLCKIAASLLYSELKWTYFKIKKKSNKGMNLEKYVFTYLFKKLPTSVNNQILQSIDKKIESLIQYSSEYSDPDDQLSTIVRTYKNNLV